MRDYTLTHLSDEVLLRDLAALVAQDRATTAALLAHIAEVDARRLYVPAGYSSMFAYCVDGLRLSEEAAMRRIQAARAGRRFPPLFIALADGRLHLTAMCLLAPHLTPESAEELIEAATHKRKLEIEEMLARRFPLRQVPPGMTRTIKPMISKPVQQAQVHVSNEALPVFNTADGHSLANVEDPQVGVSSQPAERFLVQFTIGKSTHDKLRYAQALLSHAIPTGDVPLVVDRALDALISKLEKRKFGGAPRSGRRRSTTRLCTAPGGRYVPAHVRRAVWERDQGQCTFVSASGTRCRAHRFLEFDHVNPVARGGETTVERMRLRCRAHNQYGAEREFGVGFMNRKRREARLAAEARAKAEDLANGKSKEAVVAGLRNLGCRASEARRAAEFSENVPGATLEERMRAALKVLSRRSI